MHLHDDDGATGRAEMRIGDSVVMMFDSRREPHTESRTAWERPVDTGATQT